MKYLILFKDESSMTMYCTAKNEDVAIVTLLKGLNKPVNRIIDLEKKEIIFLDRS